jgi:hypothetical protein
MVEHLTHVEDTLRLERPAGEDVDLEAGSPQINAEAVAHLLCG